MRIRITTKHLAFGISLLGVWLSLGPTTSAQTISHTSTPIRHVVVIFQENVSFDHYFATYPNATNPPGEPPFHPKPNTPTVNGLNEALLTANQHTLQPLRIDRSHVNTADQDHNYQAEQQA